MLTAIHPKLPMRDKETTKRYYLDNLAFEELADYGDYLMIGKDSIEIHFFEFKDLNPLDNYGMVYIRTTEIQTLYNNLLDYKIAIHPNAPLLEKPWGQWEFSLLDPDNNLLTFGQSLD